VLWPQVAEHQLLGALTGVALVWLLTVTNILGARQSGQVQVVTTVLKFVPLAIVAIVGLFFIDGGNYTPFAPHGSSAAITSAATLTLWAFIGLESATVPADDVKDPRRTIPRATLIGTLAATAVYIVSTVAIMGIIPTGELARSTSPFADAAAVIFGGGWDQVIAVVALISTAGALNGWILLQGQVPLAAARDGLFPRQFARLHGERQTPVFGLVVSSVLVSGLLLTNYSKGLVGAFTCVILLATLTALVPYAYSAAAQVMLLVNEPQAFRGRRLARDAAIASLAFAYSIWAIAGAGQDVIAKGFVLLLAGIPIYLWLSWRKRRAQPATAPTIPTRLRPPARAAGER
jgi:APA family basic amino acid/polyamine antiporter